MTSLVRLAGRLTAGGGRESVVRLALTGVGLALAVTMLLFAAVAFPALHAHDVRRAWTQTTPENQRPAQDESTTDPLRWRLVEDRFDGRDLLRVDVAAEGPDAPVPPGLDRLPGPGEVAVSPALRRLLDETDADPALLADRFPGSVVAIVGRDALASPNDLVAFVGHQVDELQARSGGDPRVGPDSTIRVRSIESAPISRGLTTVMRIVLVIGGVGLLIPIVVFVATATRLAAARREQRLAAMRLAGATQRQVGGIAAVEAAIAALGGTAAGFAGFLALRPWLARIPFDGASFYPSDLRLSWGWAVAVALGVPALAVGAAIVSVRRLRISPLGVARRAAPARPTPRPLLLVATGLLGLVATTIWARSSTAETAESYATGAAFVVTILGLTLSGPWLTAVAARAIARLGRRTPSLLAARRLEDNPAAGFRAISGIVLAVFVGTVFAGIAASVLASNEAARGSGDNRLATNVVAAAKDPVPSDPAAAQGAGDPGEQGEPVQAAPGREQPFRWTTLPAADAAALVDDLEALDGVERVVTAHALPEDPDLFAQIARTGAELSAPVLVGCADVAALGPERPPGCDGTTASTVLTLSAGDVDATGVVLPAFDEDELAALPVVGVAAVTDGRTSTIEQARTRLGLGIPGVPAATRRDLDAARHRELDTLRRMSNIGLSVTLVIAGCSLAVAVAGAIVERRRPFTLLRLAGTQLSDLRRVVLAEAAAPLLVVTVASVVLGLAVAYLAMAVGGVNRTYALPDPGYWLALLGGLGAALAVVLATLPLLDRLTAPDTARFE